MALTMQDAVIHAKVKLNALCEDAITDACVYFGFVEIMFTGVG